MFWNIFYRLCLDKGTKPNAVAKQLGISSASVTKWKNGSQPSSANLNKIAGYFNVTVDYLLGNTGKKEKPYADEDEELAEYLKMLKTDENYRMMLSLMKGAKKEDVEKVVKLVKALLSED